MYYQKYCVNLNLRMNFSFSGVIIIDKFGFTSRRFECNAKILATETHWLMVADIFISLFIQK